MESVIEDLLHGYEKGKLSRRQLIGGLTALAAGGGALTAAAQETPFKSTRIDHISIQVSDLGRSVEFYERIFGLAILNEDRENKIARMGVTGALVSLHEKAPTGIVDHFAIAIDDFDQQSVTATLRDQGLDPQTNLDYGFYVRDPEGIPVQIVRT